MAPAQTFQDHLKELRRRLLWIALAIGLSAGLGYMMRIRFIKILQHPLGAPLFYTSPAGSFNFVLKLSLIIGIFIALPVMIYQLLRFLEPALPFKLKRSTLIKVIASSFLLAVAGVCFGFFLMIPLSLHFFLGYSTAQIKPLITADEYLSFVLNHMLTFALAFQIPMIFLFINRIKPLRPSKLLKYQRHVVVGSFALAIILPFTYDPLSQFIVAIPIIFLYYLSVILLWITNRKQKIEPEPKQATLNEPVVENQPRIAGAIPQATNASKPVLAVTQPLSLVSPKQMRAIDGFVNTPRQMPQAKTFKTNIVEATKVDKVVHQPKRLGKPRLNIDGILPPLTA